MTTNHCLCTRYSSISTATSTVVGTATNAPTTPATADPISNPTKIDNPGNPTLDRMMRVVRNEFSTLT